MTNSSSFEELYRDAALAGELVSENSSFTVNQALARAKSQQYALVHPQSYQLLTIAALYALGARSIAVKIDADDFRVGIEIAMERQMLLDIWSHGAYISAKSNLNAGRLFSLAILTSMRLKEVSWSFYSVDSLGPWKATVRVHRSIISEPEITDRPSSPIDSVVHVRRKDFLQVAKRYFYQKLGSYEIGGLADEEVIRKRILLSSDTAFTLDGQKVSPEPEQDTNVLALLTTGTAGPILDGVASYRVKRSYNLTLCLRDLPAELSANHLIPAEIVWIWNGLKMGSDRLNGEFSHFQAFAWVDTLQPDLSFENIVDNQAKQKLVADIRSLARYLLERACKNFAAALISSPPQLDTEAVQPWLRIIRRAITERVSLFSNPNLLRKLNRTLIDCPLIIGRNKGEDLRWICFREIWRAVESGKIIVDLSKVVLEQDETKLDQPHLALVLNENERNFLKRMFKNPNTSSL